MTFTRRLQWLWFPIWSMVGGGVCVGVVGILTIGIVVIPVSLGLLAVVSSRPNSRPYIFGLVSGLGLPLLYVAYLNRGGPGNICTSILGSGGRAAGENCTQEYDPYIWLAIGFVFILAGVIFQLRHWRSLPPQSESRGQP